MRILYLTPCWPHGRSFGGQLRALHVGRALRQIGQVTIAVVSDDEPEGDAQEQTAAEFTVLPQIRVGIQRNRRASERLQWLLNPRYLNVHGCIADTADRARLLEVVPKYDLVWLLNSRTPNILQSWNWPNSVLDVDDLPSSFHRSQQQSALGVGERWKAGLEAALARRRERLWPERFNALAVCSQNDRQYFNGAAHVHVIPNGFPRPAVEPQRRPVSPARLGFIGLFSYAPNREGVRWFLRNCWPVIKKQVPEARLRLIGKDTDGFLKPQDADVDALGWMSDPAEEIATWSGIIIPVMSGAGTRIKIADAFSRKCPVVSTTLGAYGYEVRSGEELLLADDAEGFASGCISLMRGQRLGEEMAERAWRKFLARWTWESITPSVHAAADDVLRRGKRSVAP